MTVITDLTKLRDKKKMISPSWFDELISEREAYERFGRLLADKELRRARRTGQIDFVEGARGFYYHPNCLASYLSCKRRKCERNGSSNMAGSGSAESLARNIFTPAHMTREDEELVAAALARKNSRKLRDGSSRRSAPHPASVPTVPRSVS